MGPPPLVNRTVAQYSRLSAGFSASSPIPQILQSGGPLTYVLHSWEWSQAFGLMVEMLNSHFRPPGLSLGFALGSSILADAHQSERRQLVDLCHHMGDLEREFQAPGFPQSWLL